MKSIATKGLLWIALALTIPVQSYADEEDSIRTIKPLFDPVVVKDTVPDISNCPDIGKSVDSDTKSVRSGNTCKVGTPSTEASVSPMGAAVWSITFDTPPGVSGMVPTVGLAYSSQSGVGNAGWGMSISGVSSITRGTKTLYHDGVVRGVKYDTGDALFLDGRRLMLHSGTEGVSGAIYVLEGDPFTKVKITSYNSSTGPLSFEVTSPDGTISLYGTTSSSRLSITYGGGTRYHAWYISRQEDPNGNYAEFTYMHDDLTIYPEAITYGKNKNTGTGAYNQIRFFYTNAHDNTIRKFVVGGTQGSVRKCLERVKTMTGNSVYREYALSYAPVSDGSTWKYERLSSITCKNGAGEEMNPVTLGWSLLPGTARTVDTLDISTDDPDPMVEKQDSLLFAADLNGDGLADMVRISYCKHYLYNSPNSQYWEGHTYVYIHRSSRDGNGNVTYLPALRYDFGGQINYDDWKYLMGSKATADIDGDGLNDLVIPYYANSPSGSSFLRFRCIMGNDVRDGSSTSYLYDLPLVAAEDMPPFLSGDIDGNGLEDVVCLEAKMAQGYYHLGISFSLPSNARNPVNIPLTLPQKPKRLFVGDCNSDGLPDLIALYNGGYKIFYNNGGNTASALFSDSNSTSGSSFGDMWRVEQGDFNGDGLADFVYVDDDSPDYYFAMNNGDGTFSVSLAISYDLHDQSTDRDDHRFTLTPMDIDRDGLTDLVISKACFEHHGGFAQTDSFTSTLTGWLVSNGSSLTEVRRVRSYDLIDEAGPQNIMLSDFDGDGWPELANNGADWFTNTVANSDGCRIRVYHASGFSPASGKLTTATDALGATTSITYGASSNPDLFTHTFGSTFPLADIHYPLTLVSTMTKNNGLAGTHAVSYRYAGLKAHMQGKGLLGFMDIAARDNLTGVTTQNGTLTFNTSHYVPSRVYSITSMGYDNDSTVTTISVQANASSRYMSFPVTRRNVDMDGNVTTATTGYNVIDGYITVERTEYGSPLMYKQVNYSDHVRKGNRCLPGRIVSSQKHSDDTQAWTSTTILTYSATGNPVSIIEHYGSGQPLTTNTTYDTWGNVTSVSKTGQGVSTFSDNYEYDSTGRFVTRRHRDPNGEDYRFTYDTWGSVLSKTDDAETSNPLTTTYQRDNWGDVTCITHPVGNTETFSSGWGTSYQARYYVLCEAAGKAPMKTWYDVCGREYIHWTKDKKNVETTETISLNTWGNVSQIVRITGNLTNVETNGYDTRGRVVSSFKTGYGTTTYTYGNRCKTALHNNREYTTTYDAWGNVLTSTDPVSSVEYAYGSIGKPVSISSGDSEITIGYDHAGRKIQLDDPDAGTTTYAYSADGKLLQQTDGRGILTQNSYDTLGRLVTSICDTLTTTYTYGTSGHGKLRLVKRQTNDMSDEYTYDTYGRVVFVKRTFPDGVQMGHTYTYNSLDQISSHTYPSNFTITYTYDNNGYRDGVWAGDTHIWSVQSFDGTTTKYQYGNTTVTDSVSTAGRLLERYVRRNGQNSKLYRMAFSWNNTTGNLMSRTGVKEPGVTETFTYDSLDRLLSVSQGNSVTDAITYGDDGNILSKTGMGSYGYFGIQPHAVTQVDNTDYLITSASQQIAYNPFGKAALIMEGVNSQRLFYGSDKTRWMQVDSVNGQVTAKTYYFDDFEMRVSGNHTHKYHFLEEGLLTYKYDSWLTDHYYLLTDNVGSITHVVNGEGGSMFDAGYDAWGKQKVMSNSIGFFRGYGGHEMLPQYRLVNMDGRMYDYALARFLSPDDYVQEPGNCQNFNRYSYCLNNPLKYTDPDGDFFIGTILNGMKDLVVNTFGKVWKQGINAWTKKENWHSTAMSFKIDKGLFHGNLRQLVSRFTWELPQTYLGYIAATLQNTVNGVKSVSYYGGATAVETYAKEWGAFTLGSFVIGNRGLQADPYNTLFQHEYGHYLQSQRFGLFYIQRCGLPSLLDCCRSKDSMAKHPHNHHPVDQDANIRAFKYFKKHVEGYDVKTDKTDNGWDLDVNAIIGYDKSLSYYDPVNQNAMGSKLHLGWADYCFGPSLLVPSIFNIISLHQ